MSVVRKTPKFAEQQKPQTWHIPPDMDSDGSDDKENSQESVKQTRNTNNRQYQNKDRLPKDHHESLAEKRKNYKASKAKQINRLEYQGQEENTPNLNPKPDKKRKKAAGGSREVFEDHEYQPDLEHESVPTKLRGITIVKDDRFHDREETDIRDRLSKKEAKQSNRGAKGQQNTQKYNEFSDSSFKNQSYQSEEEDFDEEDSRNTGSRFGGDYNESLNDSKRPMSKGFGSLKDDSRHLSEKRGLYDGRNDFMEQRIYLNSPGSESGNFTKNLKLELRNNVEKLREMKRQNSKQSLRAEDSLMESQSTIKMSEKFSSNGFKETKKKRKKSPPPNYDTHQLSYQTKPKFEIQSKMDMINSLFDQLSCESTGRASANTAFTSTSSYGGNSKPKKGSGKANKSNHLKAEQDEQGPLDIQDLKEVGRLRKSSKDNEDPPRVLETRTQDPPSKRGKNSNIRKVTSKASAEKEQKEALQLPENSYSSQLILAETPQRNESMINNSLRVEKALNSSARVENESSRGKNSRRSYGSDPPVEESSSTPPKQRQKPGVNPVAINHPIKGKQDSARNKKAAEKKPGRKLANAAVEEEDEGEAGQQGPVGKILKNQNKPPLPQRLSNQKQRLNETKELEDEGDTHNTQYGSQKAQSLREPRSRGETPRDFLKHSSILSSSRSPNKDHISINKQQFKSSANKITKNYERILKNFDQSFKPFVQNLTQQSKKALKTLKEFKKSPISTNRSFNREGSIQIIGPNSSPARLHPNKQKADVEQSSPPSDILDERSLRAICEGFLKSADNIKQFQTEINNLAKQITDAALIMQETLQKLEHYRSIDSLGKAPEQHDDYEEDYDDEEGSQDAAEEFGVEEEEQF